MRIFTSPIYYVRSKRARKRRIQIVLHMLSASGVIRPGHVEPRYFEPSTRIDALHRQGSGQKGILTSAVADDSHQIRQDISFDFTKLRQLVRGMKPFILSLEQ